MKLVVVVVVDGVGCGGGFRQQSPDLPRQANGTCSTFRSS